MIAYLLRTPTAWIIKLTERPCSGVELLAGRTIHVSGEREARALCEACGYTAWNF